jgi:GrpB-like predicted nucleotidyltransferase (UPF0157 family)
MNSALGLTRGKVKLLPFKTQWHVLFLEEEKRLRKAIGRQVVDIQHIGSTSIPGMMSKPLLDIGVAIVHYQDGQRCVTPLRQIGYEYRGEYGIPGRHFFVKGNPTTHHIHMFEISNEIYTNYLLFRDYLIIHKETARSYARLKQRLADQYVDDRVAYQQGKAPFIQSVLQKIKQDQ